LQLLQRTFASKAAFLRSPPYDPEMSRAFVKEDAAENVDDLPERPVSGHPNYVAARVCRE
jgi:hypothetical protein